MKNKSIVLAFNIVLILLIAVSTPATSIAQVPRPFQELSCDAAKTRSDKFICSKKELIDINQSMKSIFEREIEGASDEIKILMSASQTSWSSYWSKLCADPKNKKNINVTCALKEFKTRIKQLSPRTIAGGRVFRITHYRAIWVSDMGGMLADSTLSYDQISIDTSNTLPLQIANELNSKLRPTPSDYKAFSTNMEENEILIKLISDISELWGISKSVTEWHIGANGAPSEIDTNQWHHRADLRPLKPNDIFKGKGWRDNFLLAFNNAMRRCPDGVDQDLKSALDVSGWVFWSNGILFRYSPVYYESRVCPITWTELTNAGVQLKMRPQRLTFTKGSTASASTTTSWHCVCYAERVSGVATPSVACRTSDITCNALREKIQQGSTTMIPGSASACRRINGDTPWAATKTRQELWRPSKRAGSWWSPNGCPW